MITFPIFLLIVIIPPLHPLINLHPHHSHEFTGYTLNLWDVGGQKSLRSYWRNYFESTDGLVWVVDAADRMRLDACREELNILLQEERLAGATLLVLANKQDLPGALSAQEIKDASRA